MSQTYNYVPCEYEGLSGSFAAACREADQKLRLHQSQRVAPARGRHQLQSAGLPENVIQEIDLMGDVQLDRFLEGRPKPQVEKILEYITRQLS